MENSHRGMTVQERVAALGDTDDLCMPQFRLDPERPFGQLVTICLQVRCRGSGSEGSAHRPTPDERSFYYSSIIHTLGRLIGKKSSTLSKERRQLSHYTNLLLQLKEDRASVLQSDQGVRIPVTVYCRSLEELEEIWSGYQSGQLQNELQSYFDKMNLLPMPTSVDVSIYNYEDCKRKFQFAGYRLLYLQYPQLTTQRR